MIQFVSVSKFYNDFIAVENISFQINDGEFVLLTGPSGSGKTTLIKMLIREEKPSAGKIFVGEDEVTALRRGKIYRLRRNIGVVFQDFKLIDDKNIYENVAFALEAGGKGDKEIKEIVPYVLDIVGLSDKMSAFPKELSGGQKQKAAIARAISNDPDILIADEPTGNLDEKATWDIVEILQKINEWGTTIIMCTHERSIINKLDARLLVMESGNIVSDTSNKVSRKKKEDFEENLSKHENDSGVTKEDRVIVKEKPSETKKEQIIPNQDFEKNLDENYHKRTEAKQKSKPKLKFGLKNNKKKEENLKPSFEFKEFGISTKTVKLLNQNNYKDMQDLANQPFEKIEKIEGLNGDQLIEIEKALDNFSK
ncbi:ATP-binding cassette domain-containing protein [Candidatus Dojkabacteria bacterium]|nr:ATP-binding cassette domain-containing protein [Candidatus Dojkabacteria bacterium]